MIKADMCVIGGGLAGCEAAWQAAKRGKKVILYEMRPTNQTGAHTSAFLAELVCSNSLGSNQLDRAAGLLKAELRRCGSLLIQCADKTSLPAGAALAVDRWQFSSMVTKEITDHPNIQLIREEVTHLPDGICIISTGPLSSPAITQSIQALIGDQYLFFYDAIAPIVTIESIDQSIAFWKSRYDRGKKEGGDYLNCPLDEHQYQILVSALAEAERIELRDMEQGIEQGVKAGNHPYFEACLPIEELAKRDPMALAYGPLRPTGLTDPRTGRWPYAVVQLRQDNQASTLFNLVGFQTNLKYDEQSRLIHLIPGLDHAEIVRFGQMHRNTYIFSPEILNPGLQHLHRDDLFFAGQITGVEGYTGSIASGLVAGLNAARLADEKPQLIFPRTTMIGALCNYITHASPADFQPMKANFGIMPALENSIQGGRRNRAKLHTQRALADLDDFLGQFPDKSC
jgi:methylenetetrahydrofolate--tRNA-(uracil-5-)-methyltransferase